MRAKRRNRIDHYRKVERAAQKRSRARLRKAIQKIKEERGGCMTCSEKHPAALAFHHRNPRTKRFQIQKAVTQKVAWKMVLREIKKCDLLCHNCHAKLHYRLRHSGAH